MLICNHTSLTDTQFPLLLPPSPGSQLNDRIAALEAEKAQWQEQPQPTPTSQKLIPSSSSSSSTPSTTSDPRLRADLALALAQKNAFDARLRAATAERDRLLAASRAHARTVAVLTQERDALRVRVRDQAEELRGKKAMLDAVQDDVLALETSLTLVEKQKAKLAADNRDLVERWMRRAKLEAEQMNAANERGVSEGGPS